MLKLDKFKAYLSKSVFIKLAFEVYFVREFLQKYFSLVKIRRIFSKFAKIAKLLHAKVSPLKVINMLTVLQFLFRSSVALLHTINCLIFQLLLWTFDILAFSSINNGVFQKGCTYLNGYHHGKNIIFFNFQLL